MVIEFTSEVCNGDRSKIEIYVMVGREGFMSTSHWQDAVIRGQLGIDGLTVSYPA